MFKRLLLLIVCVVCFSPTTAVTEALRPEFVALGDFDDSACVYRGGRTCSTVKDSWEEVCENYHIAEASRRNASHVVVVSKKKPGTSVLFVGSRSSVEARYYDCGLNGTPARGSKKYEEEQALLLEAKLAERELDRAARAQFGEGAWSVDIGIDPITDVDVIHFVLPSSEERLISRDSAILIVRCDGGKLDLYVNWAEFVSNDAQNVIDRVDSEPPETIPWGVSTDYQATFHPHPHPHPHPQTLISRLMFADRYVVRTIPHGENPRTAIFDVRGLEVVIRPHRQACGLPRIQ